MADPQAYLVSVPRDIETDILIGLEQLGITAQTIVPDDRDAGLIRVSRIGGELQAEGMRDNPNVLVETWGENSVDAFDRIIPVWAAFRAFEDRGIIHDDVAVHDLDIQPPRALDDPLAPGLYRVQFTAQFLTDLTETTVKET